jgi:hypothetical protein
VIREPRPARRRHEGGEPLQQLQRVRRCLSSSRRSRAFWRVRRWSTTHWTSSIALRRGRSWQRSLVAISTVRQERLTY